MSSWDVALAGLAIASALFCLFVCVLVISNYLRFRSAAPAAEASVEGTLARISEGLIQAPEDEEVSEQIESLELQIKNAYTSDISLIRLNIFLLAAGAAVLLISSTLMFMLRGGKPERTNTDTGKMPGIPAGLPGDMLIAGAGIGFAAIALIFVFLSYTTIEQDHRSVEAAIAYKAKPPTTWNGITGEGILWKVAVPKPGNNSPVLWASRLFLSGADGQVQEVYCFDGLTGEILWSRVVADIPGSPAEPPDVGPDTGYAPSTMATDGSRVFAIFPTGDVICFDFDGNQIWARNLGGFRRSS